MTVIQESPARLTRKPEEAAPMLGVGRNGVYDLIRSGQLRSIRVGRKILIPLTAIEDFLNGTGGSK
ncbi:MULTISPECIES: helix-turn-helix domain-containing protein [Deinococcus]|uniref:Helix-turn-helix domain-containing protein n=1 Tax=Deinococcus aquaticus TaxID=328692 RepID=A0ABY7UYB9_9DEIO|nr:MULTISPECIES: helix-turn-helix domain-containing protein [Deinococcus]MCD0157709.1 helix-turn-helix domain-containing protein [Deinococcus sp. 6GRE01]WDA57369.1 helix-turn-helix domain-containing protein [Deinococcus aquaticus]